MDLSEAAKQFGVDRWTVVPGLFDPLTAAQAKRISELTEDGRKLAAIVLSGRQTLLPAEARAALVAGLRAVNLVAIAHDEEWHEALGTSEHLRIVEDPKGEMARSAEFVQFVIRRQKSA